MSDIETEYYKLRHAVYNNNYEEFEKLLDTYDYKHDINSYYELYNTWYIISDKAYQGDFRYLSKILEHGFNPNLQLVTHYEDDIPLSDMDIDKINDYIIKQPLYFTIIISYKIDSDEYNYDPKIFDLLIKESKYEIDFTLTGQMDDLKIPYSFQDILCYIIDNYSKNYLTYDHAIQTIELVLQHGARWDNPNRFGITPYHFLYPIDNSFDNIKKMFEYLQKKSNLTINDSPQIKIEGLKGYTPLIHFLHIHQLHKEYIIYILNNGADEKIKDKNGLTDILKFFIESDDLQFPTFLINYGVDINHQDENGRTILFYTVNKQQVFKLAKLGAKLNIVDNNGISAIEFLYQKNILSKEELEYLKNKFTSYPTEYHEFIDKFTLMCTGYVKRKSKNRLYHIARKIGINNPRSFKHSDLCQHIIDNLTNNIKSNIQYSKYSQTPTWMEQCKVVNTDYQKKIIPKLKYTSKFLGLKTNNLNFKELCQQLYNDFLKKKEKRGIIYTNQWKYNPHKLQSSVYNKEVLKDLKVDVKKLQIMKFNQNKIIHKVFYEGAHSFFNLFLKLLNFRENTCVLKYIIWNVNLEKLIYSNEIKSKIENCKKNNKRFIIMYMTLYMKYEDSHANTLIIDTEKKTLELFEPHGHFTDPKFKHNLLEEKLKDFSNSLELTYIPFKESCPKIGVQSYETLNDNNIIGKLPGGFCSAWALWWPYLRLNYPDISSKKLHKLAVEKLTKKTDNLLSYIVNYSNFATFLYIVKRTNDITVFNLILNKLSKYFINSLKFDNLDQIFYDILLSTLTTLPDDSEDKLNISVFFNLNVPINIDEIKKYSNKINISYNHKYINYLDLDVYSNDSESMKEYKKFLKDNNKKIINFMIDEMSKENEIYLKNLKLKTVPERIRKHANNIHTLSIVNNDILKIPQWIDECINLQWLDIGNNPIKEFPNELGNLQNLTTLLMYKTITINDEFPIVIKKLKNLEELRTSVVPEWIDKLHSLKKLSIKDKKLHIPLSISKSSIEDLTIISKSLTKIVISNEKHENENTLTLPVIKSLKRIDISVNLQELPENINKFENLELIEIFSSNIKNFPLSLKTMKKLKTIIIFGQNINIDEDKTLKELQDKGVDVIIEY